MYLILLLFFLFASVFSLQKQSLQYGEPVFLIGFRMFFAGFILLLICFFTQKKKSFIISYKHFYLFFFLSLFGVYLTNVCEILSMTVMTSSKVCLIYSLSPFFTAILSFFFFKESLSLKKFFGLFLGFISFIPMSYNKTAEEISYHLLFSFSFYEILLFFAVLFSVFGWILLKKLNSLGYSVFIVNGYSMFIGGFFSILHSIIFSYIYKKQLIYNFHYFIFYSTLICIISNIICYNLFGFLLRRYSVTLLTFAGLLTPIFSVFFDYFLLKEKFSYYFFPSFFLVAFGLYIFYQQEADFKKKS